MGKACSIQLLANVTGIAVFLISWPCSQIRLAEDRPGARGSQREDPRRDRSAEEAREQANSALADYGRELSRARGIIKMIADAKAQAKALADELREKNEQELSERMARASRHRVRQGLRGLGAPRPGRRARVGMAGRSSP